MPQPNISRRHKQDVARIHRRTVQKGLNDPDNHNGVVTHLESHILEYKVEWVLGSINTKLVEVMEFKVSYFKS